MKPKYTERFTQGVAISVAALALSGCDDNRNYSDNDVETTAPTITKEVDAKRAMLNKCLEDGDPKYHPAYIIAHGKIAADSSPTRTMAYVGSVFAQINVNLADCGVNVSTGHYACRDKNADSVWENVRASGCRCTTPLDTILRYSQSIEDREERSEVWQSVQEECNETYNSVLKNAGERSL